MSPYWVLFLALAGLQLLALPLAARRVRPGAARLSMVLGVLTLPLLYVGSLFLLQNLFEVNTPVDGAQATALALLAAILAGGVALTGAAVRGAPWLPVVSSAVLLPLSVLMSGFIWPNWSPTDRDVFLLAFVWLAATLSVPHALARTWKGRRPGRVVVAAGAGVMFAPALLFGTFMAMFAGGSWQHPVEILRIELSPDDPATPYQVTLPLVPVGSREAHGPSPRRTWPDSTSPVVPRVGTSTAPTSGSRRRAT